MLSNFLHGRKIKSERLFQYSFKLKMCITYILPFRIISTRVFEALGSGAIGIFASDSKVDVIFEDGNHFISFSRIKDFINTIYLIKKSKGILNIRK